MLAASRALRSVKFQSHAGSIEAARCVPRDDPVLQFQSHAGSIEAPLMRIEVTGETEQFQSHAGSIEAAGHQIRPRRPLLVSIPRWFD